MSGYEPRRPKPNYFDRDMKRPKSKKQEDRVAKKLGGKRQKASGALPFHKGDVKTVELLIEAKRTDNASMSIKREWLEKITMEAAVSSKTPAVSIEFEGTHPLVDKDWIMVPSRFFQELLSRYRGEI